MNWKKRLMTSSDGQMGDLGFKGVWLPVAARSLIRGITSTVRIHREGFEHFDSLQASGSRAVLAFFHGRQFLLLGCFAGKKIATMASFSRDGELQARTMSGLGYGIVRGSASRGGARGLIGLIKLMGKGYWPCFAVDGPKGPIHEVKPGAVYLAKKSGIPVIPLVSSARPAHIFEKAWDRYLLPLPFSRGAVVLGEPITFDDDLDEEAITRDCEFLRKELLRLQERADKIAGLTFNV
jgi:lysophospholipid acyltransferase (LPLAT)-like uncharacterized protein